VDSVNIYWSLHFSMSHASQGTECGIVMLVKPLIKTARMLLPSKRYASTVQQPCQTLGFLSIMVQCQFQFNNWQLCSWNLFTDRFIGCTFGEEKGMRKTHAELMNMHAYRDQRYEFWLMIGCNLLNTVLS